MNEGRRSIARRRAPHGSREQVFRAAAAEFAAHGFEAAGVDRIAAKARVNKAMIYYHFGSKLELYTEVLRDMFRAVGARARALADSDLAPDAKLDAWVNTIVEEASARPWFPPIMLRELASGVPRFDPETLGLMNLVVAAWLDIVAEGQRAGVFRADADGLLAHLTIMPAVLVFFIREQALVRRSPKQTSLVAGPRSREQFIEHMQHAVRGMLRKV